MRKLLVILFISIICLTGCSLFENKYKDYEHYDLTDYRYQIYKYHRTQIAEKYAIAVISPKDKENDNDVLGHTEGLLYEVGENDYILLDSFAGGITEYKNENFTLMYNDKIYLLRGGCVFAYTLDKENTQKEDFRFDFRKILDLAVVSGYFSVIEGIDNDYIYVKGNVWGYEDPTGPMSEQKFSLHMKCSLKDYTCMELE